MMQPIDKLMNEQVDWKCTDRLPTFDDEGSPYATHEGVWDSPFGRLRVYRLNTGESIINAQDLEATEFWREAIALRFTSGTIIPKGGRRE